MCVSTISLLQRFPLFCQWFRSGCIWIARTNVVSACIAHKLLNRQRDVNEIYVCHFDWKVSVWLENSVGIFGCHSIGIRSGFVCFVDCRMPHNIRDFGLFVYNCVKQMHQRKFIRDRPKNSKQKESTHFGSFHWIRSISRTSQTVEYKR